MTSLLKGFSGHPLIQPLELSKRQPYRDYRIQHIPHPPASNQTNAGSLCAVNLSIHLSRARTRRSAPFTKQSVPSRDMHERRLYDAQPSAASTRHPQQQQRQPSKGPAFPPMSPHSALRHKHAHTHTQSVNNLM